MGDAKDTNFIELAAGIVSAYVSKNSVPSAELPKLIQDVHDSLLRLGAPQPAPANETLRPAVPPKKSIFDDHLVCLEDGKKFKSLKRHLRSHYNLTPAQYREKWGLPADYPMVAPSYAKARSRLARQMGLGQQRGKE